MAPSKATRVKVTRAGRSGWRTKILAALENQKVSKGVSQSGISL
jgi:hypothetical protein